MDIGPGALLTRSGAPGRNAAPGSEQRRSPPAGPAAACLLQPPVFLSVLYFLGWRQRRHLYLAAYVCAPLLCMGQFGWVSPPGPQPTAAHLLVCVALLAPCGVPPGFCSCSVWGWEAPPLAMPGRRRRGWLGGLACEQRGERRAAQEAQDARLVIPAINGGWLAGRSGPCSGSCLCCLRASQICWPGGDGGAADRGAMRPAWGAPRGGTGWGANHSELQRIAANRSEQLQRSELVECAWAREAPQRVLGAPAGSGRCVQLRCRSRAGEGQWACVGRAALSARASKALPSALLAGATSTFHCPALGTQSFSSPGALLGLTDGRGGRVVGIRCPGWQGYSSAAPWQACLDQPAGATAFEAAG